MKIFWFQAGVLEPLIGEGFNITKAGFLIFFAASLIVYYLTPKTIRWGILFISSLAFFFFVGTGLKHFPDIIVIGFFVYFFGILIGKSVTGEPVAGRAREGEGQAEEGERQTGDDEGQRKGILEKKENFLNKIFASPKTSKILLFIAVVFLFGSLAYFRCFDFFVTTDAIFGKLFSVRIGLHEINMIAPFGIAYFSLTSISYLTDVYRGVIKYEKNPYKVFTYIFFWPCMTCGPILRYGEDGTGELAEGIQDSVNPKNGVGPQDSAGSQDKNSTGSQKSTGSQRLTAIFQVHEFSYQNIAFGAQRMLWGFFKKVVVADRLAILVNTVYADPEQYTGFYILVALFFFGIQLYCDFSGCLDIVIGAAQMYGIKLPENFNTPFFSSSFAEFFRRWHVTLGLFGKDYIMYPLMRLKVMQKFTKFLKGKKKSKFRKELAKKLPVYIGIFVTWFIIGFWHGGSYKFIICAGVIPAFFMIFGDLLTPFGHWVTKILHINRDTFTYKLFQWLRTITFVYFGVWLIFAASSLKNAIVVVKSLLSLRHDFNLWVITDNETLYTLGIDRLDMFIMFVCILTVFAVEIIHYNNIRIREFIAEQNLVARWIFFYFAIFVVIIFGVYGPSFDPTDFIYRG